MINLQTQMPRVAISLLAANKTDRDVLLGILRFVHLHSPWVVHIEDGRTGEYRLRSLARWGCTGMIVSDVKVTSGISAFVREKQVPVVTIGNAFRGTGVVGRVDCDNVAIAQLAAGYLRRAAFTNFAFVGEMFPSAWSNERGRVFQSELAAVGLPCVCYPAKSQDDRHDADVEQRKLARWIRKLPKPVAIFASTDFRARQVLDACLLEKLSVPDEVSILGIDNDETLCETAIPSISSIPMNTEEIGFQAGRLLDEAMHGTRLAKPVSLIYTGRSVVTRQSTQPHRINDPVIRRCFELIELNLGSRLRVNDLAASLGTSRRSLEMRMKAITGKAIAEQIYALRLKRAAALLRETSMSIGAVADLCGFANDSHLSVHFERSLGMTPYAYRRANQVKSPISPLRNRVQK